MSISSEDRLVWEPDGVSTMRPHSSLADSDEAHQRLTARQMGDAQASAAASHAGAGAALQGRRYQLHRPAPQLLHADLPRVTVFPTEIIRETRGRERFAPFPADEYAESDPILVSYRIYSREILRRTQIDARNMFLRDIREVERRASPEMQLLLQNLAHCPP